ncbi:MAG: DUF1616 domain-containing protein [Dehalococcoidales bacterium]|nr:DUF1616 domain-containing protein [Dehalococcoidales bacterium]
MSVLEVLRMFFGGLFVLFLPGFAWSYVFFAKKNIDWIERAALSFGISIALVPLAVFWLNWLFHTKITLLNTSLTVFGLILIAGVCIFIRKSSWSKDAAGK